jgi:hypothetical protein
MQQTLRETAILGYNPRQEHAKSAKHCFPEPDA